MTASKRIKKTYMAVYNTSVFFVFYFNFRMLFVQHIKPVV